MGPDECHTDNWFELQLKSSALFKRAASIVASSKQASLAPPGVSSEIVVSPWSL